MKTKMNVKLTGIALSVAALFSVAASASEAVVVTSVPGSLSHADGVIIGGGSSAAGVRHRGGMGNAIVSVGSPTGGIAIGAAGSAAGSAAINLGNGLLEPVAGVAGSVTGHSAGLVAAVAPQAASGCARYGHRCAGRRGR